MHNYMKLRQICKWLWTLRKDG